MKKLDISSFSPATHRVLRDINDILVLNVIREKQPISRTDIAGLIGIEGSTVTKIVSRLLANDLIYEDGSSSSSPLGGRKKRYLHINPRKALVVGVDFQPSKYTIAMSDFTGRVLRSVELPASRDPVQGIRRVASALRRLLDDYADETVEGIGVSLVGLVDAEGRMRAGEGLGWGDDVRVGSILRQELELDLPIYFENGAWLSALGEIWFGAHVRPADSLVFLTVGEGIGAGLVIRGQLYHGSGNGAGEFGHIPLDPAGPLCSCGGRGCLETYASDAVTVRRYRDLRGEDLPIQIIVERALRGEPEALATVRETASFLGQGLLPVVYSLDPEVIVFGGALMRAWKVIEPLMRGELAARASRFYLDRLKLIPTTLKSPPPLAGAIALVLARSFTLSGTASLGGSR